MKGTVLDITSPKQNPWPLFWYIQLLLVLVPVNVISALGIAGVWSTGAHALVGAVPGTETEVALTVIGTLLLYISSLALMLRVVRLKKLRDELIWIRGHEGAILWYAKGFILIGTSIFIVFTILGFRHAFIESWLTSRRLLEVRLMNNYHTGVPSQIIPILFWIGYILSMLGGFTFRLKRKSQGFFILLYSLFLTSALGNKAPIVITILLWIIAARMEIPKSWYSLRTVAFGGFSLIFVGGLIYALFLRQYPNAGFSEFILYVLSRLGIGQMNGTYITFGWAKTDELPVGNYYWGLIPGASFLNKEYINYQKVIMMISEGYSYTEMGVVNSYFIAEAFAIGGYPLLWLSPIIVAVTSAIAMVILRKMFKFLLWKPIAPQMSLVLFLLTHDITGGFNGFPFLKSVLLVASLLSFALLPIKFWRSLRISKIIILVPRDEQ